MSRQGTEMRQASWQTGRTGTVTFGSFQFDLESHELIRNGSPVPLQHQPARLLGLLIERAGTVVTREEVRVALWGNRHVEAEQGMNYCVRHLRAALGESASRPVFIETLRGRGYRFVGAVQSRREMRHSNSRRAPILVVGGILTLAAMALLAIGLRPAVSSASVTVALVPFENLTDNPSCTWAVRNIADAIQTAISRSRPPRLRVIPAGAAATTYLLTGSMSPAGGKNRISMRVIRTADGAVVWRYTADSPLAGGQPPTIAMQLIRALEVETTGRT